MMESLAKESDTIIGVVDCIGTIVGPTGGAARSVGEAGPAAIGITTISIPIRLTTQEISIFAETNDGG